MQLTLLFKVDEGYDVAIMILANMYTGLKLLKKTASYHTG